MTTRSQRLLKEDNSILLKIKRLQENVKKIQKRTTVDKIPEFTIMSQNPKKISMPIKPLEEKIDNVKRISKNIRWSIILWKILKGIRKIYHCLKYIVCLSRKKKC